PINTGSELVVTAVARLVMTDTTNPAEIISRIIRLTLIGALCAVRPATPNAEIIAMAGKMGKRRRVSTKKYDVATPYSQIKYEGSANTASAVIALRSACIRLDHPSTASGSNGINSEPIEAPYGPCPSRPKTAPWIGASRVVTRLPVPGRR